MVRALEADYLESVNGAAVSTIEDTSGSGQTQTQPVSKNELAKDSKENKENCNQHVQGTNDEANDISQSVDAGGAVGGSTNMAPAPTPTPTPPLTIVDTTEDQGLTELMAGSAARSDAHANPDESDDDATHTNLDTGMAEPDDDATHADVSAEPATHPDVDAQPTVAQQNQTTNERVGDTVSSNTVSNDGDGDVDFMDTLRAELEHADRPQSPIKSHRGERVRARGSALPTSALKHSKPAVTASTSKIPTAAKRSSKSTGDKTMVGAAKAKVKKAAKVASFSKTRANRASAPGFMAPTKS